MAYEIKKYNEYTWMIEDQLSEVSLTRFFLLAGNDRALMIDAGMNTKNAKEIGEGILKEAGLYDKLISEEKPMLIAITHGHGDHMGGLGAFSDLYMSLTDYQQFGVENNYSGIAFHPIKEGIRSIWAKEFWKYLKTLDILRAVWLSLISRTGF